MAPRGETVRVKGYRDFLRAADRAGKETKREVRGAFREVGDLVRVDAASRLADISNVNDATVRGLRTRVRARGVAVEQSQRRTTGLRPDFGKLQMRDALIPALGDNEAKVDQAMQDALDRVADHFER